MSPDLQFAGGRRVAIDPKDKDFLMKKALRAGPLPTYRYWTQGPQLPFDQGQTGTCVAHAWAGFEACAPLMTNPVPSPFDAYRGIVLLDEWDDNDNEATLPNDQLQAGTSVRAGAKYLTKQGRLKSYVWAESADDLAKFVLTVGPAVMGTNWYWDMSDPAPKTEIVNIGGGIAGGHAWLVYGYNRVTRIFRAMNSWGPTWGQMGRFSIRHADMQRLILEEGEACSAVEQKISPLF